LHRISDFFADRYPQSSNIRLVRTGNDGEAFGIGLFPLSIYPQVVLSFPDPLFFPKRLGFHSYRRSFGGCTALRGPLLGNRQVLTALCPPPVDDISATFGRHPHKKSVGSFSFGVAENREVLFHLFLLQPLLINFASKT
jgi:hypothetical protein